MRNLTAVGLLAGLLAACSPAAETTPGATDGAPAVSPSVEGANAPRNDAVAADANMNASGQTPGANSFTEDQARGRIEAAGYTNVSPLTQGEQGVWRGTGTRDGAQVEVSVDYRGAVTPPAADQAAR